MPPRIDQNCQTMAHDVLTSVQAIMASFINGFDVMARMREKHKQKTRRRKDEHEFNATDALSRSLQQSPWQIGQVYEDGLRGAGAQFACGDGQAHTALNEILLRLNTGLVNIIAAFLNHGSRSTSEIDYRALTTLSDASRRDSIGALRQLYQRLMACHLPAAPHRQKVTDQLLDQRGQSRLPTAQTKIRGPTIAHVTIEDSSRRAKLAIVKPSTNIKRNTASSSSTNLSRASSPRTLNNSPSQLSLSGGRKHIRGSSSELMLTSQRNLSNKQSFANNSQQIKSTRGKASSAAAAKSSTDLPPSYSAVDVSMPPMRESARPSVRHVNTRPGATPRRVTPTLYSIATDTTKLGEIAMHKWAVPYDFDAASMLNKEAMQNGWPLRDIGGELLARPKRRWFGLLRRKEAAVR